LHQLTAASGSKRHCAIADPRGRLQAELLASQQAQHLQQQRAEEQAAQTRSLIEELARYEQQQHQQPQQQPHQLVLNSGSHINRSLFPQPLADAAAVNAATAESSSVNLADQQDQATTMQF
jgi:hypothetical protein